MNHHDHEVVQALDRHIRSHMTKLRIMIGLSAALTVGLSALAWSARSTATRQIIMEAEVAEHEVEIQNHGTEIHMLHANAEKINSGIDRIEEAVKRIDNKLP